MKGTLSMHASKKRALAAIVLCGGSSLVCLAQSIKLLPKYPVGRARYVELRDDTDQIISSGGAGEGMTIKNNSVFGLLEKVESASPDKTVMSFTYERIAMSGNSPAGATDYDSDRKAQPDDVDEDLSPVFSPMLGESVKLELGPDMRPTAATGFKEIVAKVEKEVGSNMLFDQIKRSLTDEVFMTQWSVRMQFVGDRELKSGDTWKSTVKTKLPFLGEMKYDFDNALKSIEKKNGTTLASIAFEGKGESVGPGETAPGMPGPLKLESSSVRGTVIFDIDKGEILNEDTGSDMVIRMGSPPASQSAEKPNAESGMKIVVKRKGVVKTLSGEERAKQKAEIAAASAKKPTEKPAASAAASKPAEKP